MQAKSPEPRMLGNLEAAARLIELARSLAIKPRGETSIIIDEHADRTVWKIEATIFKNEKRR